MTDESWAWEKKKSDNPSGWKLDGTENSININGKSRECDSGKEKFCVLRDIRSAMQTQTTRDKGRWFS